MSQAHPAGTRRRDQAEDVLSHGSRRAQRRVAQQRARRRRKIGVFGSAAILALTAVIIFASLSGPSNGGSTDDLPVSAAPARDSSVAQDGRSLGDPDAPVTVIEYADFQCSACGVFALSIEPRLVDDYIATGKVRLIYHDFPFLDDRDNDRESNLASEGAFCAQGQGQFWNFHDLLYTNQSGVNDGAFARGRLITMARELGLDSEQFTSCLDGDEFEDDVQALYDGAIRNGVNSTPTFDINGKVVVGASYDAIKREIDAALAGR